MPLHKVPLCNIKYVGDSPLSGATFNYDVRHRLSKSEVKLCNHITTNVEKKDSFLLQLKNNQNLDRKIIIKDYNLKQLSIINNVKMITKSQFTLPLKPNIDLIISKSPNLRTLYDIRLEKEIIKEVNMGLSYSRELGLYINHSLEIETISVSEISKPNVLSILSRIDYTGLNRIKNSYMLSREHEFSLNKPDEMYLHTNKNSQLDILNNNNNNRYLGVNREYDFVISKEKYVKPWNRDDLVIISNTRLLINNNGVFKIDRHLGNILLDREYNKEIDNNSLLLYLSTTNSHSLSYSCKSKSLTFFNLLEINNNSNNDKFMYHTKVKPIDKSKNNKNICNTKLHSLYIKSDLLGLNKLKGFNINKAQEISVNLSTAYPIIKSIGDKLVNIAQCYKINKHHGSKELLGDTIKNIIISHNYRGLQLLRDRNINISNVKNVFSSIPLLIYKGNDRLGLNKLVKFKSIVIEEEKQILKIKELESLDIIQDNKNLSHKIYGLDKDSGQKDVDKHHTFIDIPKNNIYLSKLSKFANNTVKGKYLEMPSKTMNKLLSSIPLYKSNKLIDKIKYRLMYKSNLIGIIKGRYKLMYKSRKPLKINFTKGLNKKSKNIYSNPNYYGFNKDNTLLVNIPNIKGLNKGHISIFQGVLKFVNKDKISTFLIDNKSLYREKRIPIITPRGRSLYRERMPILYGVSPHLLEVTKRWWVLNVSGPYDNKILPYDYNYKDKPLWVNRRDVEWGGHYIELKNHPISYMPYLEENKGGDLSYGTKEIALSVEIMLDMTNLLVMIFKHSASQFANCSGQEAIEFIMELFFDWLNLDSTIEEMGHKGSRDHYLRCYRWLRWEAEKVWFIADKDHSTFYGQGIKYAGMLVQNILEYMKDHHFNIVPLWRNVTYMDIERQFNREATNNDIIKELDKLKCQRHYYVETKYLGGRK